MELVVFFLRAYEIENKHGRRIRENLSAEGMVVDLIPIHVHVCMKLSNNIYLDSYSVNG